MTTGQRQTPPNDATPYAILRHDEPAGGHHFDWLLSRVPEPLPDDRALLAFRCPAPPSNTVIEAVRIPDHRAHYLTYQGPLTGRRGRVTRIEQGRATIDESGHAIIIRLFPRATSPFAYRAEPVADRVNAWRLTPI